MRTTITLEPDIAAHLHELASERGTSFSATVDVTLCAGLDPGTSAAKPYREVTRSPGVQPGVNLTKALRITANLRDEETVRMLELRK